MTNDFDVYGTILYSSIAGGKGCAVNKLCVVCRPYLEVSYLVLAISMYFSPVLGLKRSLTAISST